MQLSKHRNLRSVYEFIKIVNCGYKAVYVMCMNVFKCVCIYICQTRHQLLDLYRMSSTDISLEHPVKF